MAITYVGENSLVYVNYATDDGEGGAIPAYSSVAEPAGVIAGDFILALVECSTAGSVSTNQPSGWTLLARDAHASSFQSVSLYYKIATGTAITQSWGNLMTTGFLYVSMSAWRGSTSLCIDLISGNRFIASGSTATASGYLAPVKAGALVYVQFDRSSLTSTAPSGFVYRTGYNCLKICDKLSSPAGYISGISNTLPSSTDSAITLIQIYESPKKPIEYSGSASYQNTFSTGSFNFSLANYPSNAKTGDFLLAVVSASHTDVESPMSVQAPIGWVQAGNEQDDGTMISKIWYKKCTSAITGETWSKTAGGGEVKINIYRYSPAGTVSIDTDVIGTSSTLSVSGMTATKNGALVAAFTSVASNNLNLPTAPTDFSQHKYTSRDTTSPSLVIGNVSDKLINPSGAIPTITFTGASYSATTVAFQIYVPETVPVSDTPLFRYNF